MSPDCAWPDPKGPSVPESPVIMSACDEIRVRMILIPGRYPEHPVRPRGVTWRKSRQKQNQTGLYTQFDFQAGAAWIRRTLFCHAGLGRTGSAEPESAAARTLSD